MIDTAERTNAARDFIDFIAWKVVFDGYMQNRTIEINT
jgi:hypothetical protein